MSEDLLVPREKILCPPIPPGCPYITVWKRGVLDPETAGRDGTLVLSIPGIGNEAIGLITELEKDGRALIAAVARCAWLDEAKKHSTDAVDDVLTMRPYLQVQAEQKAEAWAAWGRESK